MKYLLFATIILFTGCSFYREAHYHVIGDNIKTPYGTGNVNAEIKSTTIWSIFTNECSRPTTNITK